MAVTVSDGAKRLVSLRRRDGCTGNRLVGGPNESTLCACFGHTNEEKK